MLKNAGLYDWDNRSKTCMFAKKQKKSTTPKAPPPPRADFVQLLTDAIDRNTSIGIVHQGKAGNDPLAQGRLLEWKDNVLVIEELQIIGRDVVLKSNDSVEAYLSYNGTMLTFDAKVLKVEMPRKLNKQRVVRALHISNPMNLREGDRRSAFRASLSGLAEEIPVKMWFLDRFKPDDEIDESLLSERTTSYYTDLMAAKNFDAQIPVDEDGVELISIDWNPVLKMAMLDIPHAEGRLIDVTSNGLGILMYGISNMQLDRFERIGLSFMLEGQQLDFVVEVRQGTDLRGSTCRMGVLIVYPDRRDGTTLTRRTLEQFAMKIQRDQLKSRKAS